MMMLVLKHPLLLASRPAAFLAANLFVGLLVGALYALDPLFQPVTQLAPRQEAVQGLRPLALAFDFDTGWFVEHVNARRGLVDLLPALAGAFYEPFNKIRFSNAQAGHPGDQLGFFFGFDGEQ